MLLRLRATLFGTGQTVMTPQNISRNQVFHASQERLGVELTALVEDPASATVRRLAADAHAALAAAGGGGPRPSTAAGGVLAPMPPPVTVKLRLFCLPYAGGVSENVFARHASQRELLTCSLPGICMECTHTVHNATQCTACKLCSSAGGRAAAPVLPALRRRRVRERLRQAGSPEELLTRSPTSHDWLFQRTNE